jgi:UV DNA damage repair endonuclease
VTRANLDALEAILRWKVEHDIRVFRISSNSIPFGPHRNVETSPNAGGRRIAIRPSPQRNVET